MSLPFNIAIDGHSSCGKSTIAKAIATNYGMRYIDTGAMYRAVTLYCMRHKIITNEGVNLKKLFSALDKIIISFEFNLITNKSETILNGENVEFIIRGSEVSERVSLISQIKQIRKKLINLQQEIGRYKNVVMDGRDIGSVVFPNAGLKLFITASSSIRANRRYNQLVKNESTITFDQVLINITERDKNDSNRNINPLIKANDAILIDNSYLSIEEQDILINKLIQTKINNT